MEKKYLKSVKILCKVLKLPFDDVCYSVLGPNTIQLGIETFIIISKWSGVDGHKMAILPILNKRLSEVPSDLRQFIDKDKWLDHNVTTYPFENRPFNLSNLCHSPYETIYEGDTYLVYRVISKNLD